MGAFLDNVKAVDGSGGLYIPELLAQGKVHEIIQEFSKNLECALQREIASLDCDGQLTWNGVVVDLDSWVYRIMFDGSGKTLFWETWPTDETSWR